MILKYLRDTLFVSHGIFFENQAEVEVPEAVAKELLDTFDGYFKAIIEDKPKEVVEKPKKAAPAVKN